MLIRCLQPADAEAQHVLRLRSLKENPESFGSTYEEEVNFTLDRIQARCPVPRDHFAIGAFDENGALVGIAAFRRQTHVKANHKGSVAGMYVAPEVRGKGIGRAIMQALIERARTLPGLEQIQLQVVTMNLAARDLYRSMGFESYGVERNASKHNGEYHDDEFLVLHLT